LSNITIIFLQNRDDGEDSTGSIGSAGYLPVSIIDNGYVLVL